MSASSPDRRQSLRDDLFSRADAHWDRGELSQAFRLFRTAAKNGDRSSFLNVGYFLDLGIGIRRNRDEAMYWHKRAWSCGDPCAATNIGTIWRDEKKPRRALSWFKKAVKFGDHSAHLDIAKLYIDRNEAGRAAVHLGLVCRSGAVSEATAEEAAQLLKELNQRRRRNRF